MTVQHPSYRVAAVQAAPVFLNLDATVDKTIALIEEAAQGGASLIAFPETWIPGYPWFAWLGAPIWGMKFLQAYHDNSLIIDGAQFERITQAASRYNITVVLGFSEKDAGSLYISQAIISPEGKAVTRRKLKPTHVERTMFGEGDGSDLAVHATPLGRIGALCCWEHLQPLTKYAMYAQNEQVHVAAWPSFSLYVDAAYALGPEVNTAASRLYAAEGQCFVVAPCATVSQEMVNLMCETPEQQTLLKIGGGHARIYGPDGRSLADPLPPEVEGLLYADIDLGVITLAKAAADPSGHYSRPDVTQLLLDRNPKPRVVYVKQEPNNNVNSPDSQVDERTGSEASDNQA
ncbi:carbon-nitrogen hydrolase family protein [Cupriavidus oxalaticus]|uniref:carbon-nitrogen hydrolase family protein n=1 Tax=Cupriavidus oxalaticus TaxID=96344 RepID=UPI0031801A40